MSSVKVSYNGSDIVDVSSGTGVKTLTCNGNIMASDVAVTYDLTGGGGLDPTSKDVCVWTIMDNNNTSQYNANKELHISGKATTPSVYMRPTKISTGNAITMPTSYDIEEYTRMAESAKYVYVDSPMPNIAFGNYTVVQGVYLVTRYFIDNYSPSCSWFELNGNCIVEEMEFNAQNFQMNNAIIRSTGNLVGTLRIPHPASLGANFPSTVTRNTGSVNNIVLGESGGTLPDISNWSTSSVFNGVDRIYVPVASIVAFKAKYDSIVDATIYPIEPQPTVSFIPNKSKIVSTAFPASAWLEFVATDAYGCECVDQTVDVTCSDPSVTLEYDGGNSYYVTFNSTGTFTFTCTNSELTATCSIEATDAIPFSILKSSDWITSGTTNYDFTLGNSSGQNLGEIVFESGVYHINNGCGAVQLRFPAEGTVTIKAYSDMESSYDYITCLKVGDTSFSSVTDSAQMNSTISTKSNSTTNHLVTTKSKQKSVQTATVNVTASQVLQFGVRKDGSGNTGADKAWIGITYVET